MDYNINRFIKPVMYFVIIALFLFFGEGYSIAVETGTSKVIFIVKWYDVGKEALVGLKGVKKVEKGFRLLREINTVYYDPEVITIKEMEMALKKAGTYMETVKWSIVMRFYW